MQSNTTSEKAIYFTETAIEHFKNFVKHKNIIGIEITLKKTGCSGYAYNVNIVNSAPKNHICIIHSDLMFFIDKTYAACFNGLKIDYRADKTNFINFPKLVYENPNELAKCGCGISFNY